MKKIISLFLLLSLVGCNKNNQQPAPPPQTNSPTNPTPPPLTSLEQQLVGKWLLDSTRINPLVGTTHSDTTWCHLTLKSEYMYPVSTLPDKKALWSLNCVSNLSGGWKVEDNLLKVLTYNYQVLTVTSSFLKIKDGQTTYYLHK